MASGFTAISRFRSKPGALVEPSGAGLVDLRPRGPVLDVAGWPEPDRGDGDEAADLGTVSGISKRPGGGCLAWPFRFWRVITGAGPGQGG